MQKYCLCMWIHKRIFQIFSIASADMVQRHLAALLIIVNSRIGPFVTWIRIDIWYTIQRLMFMKEQAMDMDVKFNQLLMTNIRNVSLTLFSEPNHTKTIQVHSIKLGFNWFEFSISVCYLGYGSPAKLLSSAIKKVVSVPTELDCKNECIRFRENTPFKCYSFSFGWEQSLTRWNTK